MQLGFREVCRLLGSRGRFPVAAGICNGLPVWRSESIAAARVAMAMLWISDSAKPEDGGAIRVHASVLRAAAGFEGEGSYRSTLQGLRGAVEAAVVTPEGGVVRLFEAVDPAGATGRKEVVYRVADDVARRGGDLVSGGYGMVDMREIHALTRFIDAMVYLRLCAVRKRRKREVRFTRDEVFLLTGHDPTGSIGAANRAFRRSVARVARAMKCELEVRGLPGAEKWRDGGSIVTMARGPQHSKSFV